LLFFTHFFVNFPTRFSSGECREGSSPWKTGNSSRFTAISNSFAGSTSRQERANKVGDVVMPSGPWTTAFPREKPSGIDSPIFPGAVVFRKSHCIPDLPADV